MTLRPPLQRQYRCCGFREVRLIQKSSTAEEKQRETPGTMTEKGAQSCLEEKLCRLCGTLAHGSWHCMVQSTTN